MAAAGPAPLRNYFSAEHIKLPADKLAALVSKGNPIQFDATRHTAYCPPEKRFTMSEMGYDPKSTDNKLGVPPVIDFAHTAPFRLLSDAGVEAMRKAVLSKEVLDNCPFQLADGKGALYTHWQLRNASKHNMFIKDFWQSPTVTAMMVDALGYDIVPTMEFEMGHVNLQAPVMDKIENGVTGWHTDSNCQFVCILMLSDATNMEGGETAFKRGDGSVALVKYPAAGYAIMMQGLNILHSVTEVTSGHGERMSMVTSYQPKDHMAPQNGRIKYIHCLAADDDRNQMMGEYASWRLGVLSTRMAELSKEVEKDKDDGKFDLAAFKAKSASLLEFLDITMDNVVDRTAM